MQINATSCNPLTTNELVIGIFHHLKLKDLFRAQKVCQLWKELAIVAFKDHCQKEFAVRALHVGMAALVQEFCEDIEIWLKGGPFEKWSPLFYYDVNLTADKTCFISLGYGKVGLFSLESRTWLRSYHPKELAGAGTSPKISFTRSNQQGHLLVFTQPGGLSCLSPEKRIWQISRYEPIDLLRTMKREFIVVRDASDKINLLDSTTGKREKKVTIPSSGKKVVIHRTLTGATLSAIWPIRKRVDFWEIKENRKGKVLASSLGSISCSNSNYYQWQALRYREKFYAIGVPIWKRNEKRLLFALLKGKNSLEIPEAFPLDESVLCFSATSTPSGIILAVNLANKGVHLSTWRCDEQEKLSLTNSLTLESLPLFSLQMLPIADPRKSSLLLFGVSNQLIYIWKASINYDGELRLDNLRTIYPSLVASFSALNLRPSSSGLEAIATTNKGLIYQLLFSASS